MAPTPDGGRIYYELDQRAGAALPPVLLIRPLGGTLALWGEFRQRLGRTRPVLSFDARGSGRSSPLGALTSTRSMAADVVCLLAHLGLARVHVFGLSLGGMVAQWLAIDAPAAVERLVLASTSAHKSPPSRAGMLRAWRLGTCLLRGGAEAEVCLARRVLSDRFRGNEAEVRRIETRVRSLPAGRRDLVRLLLAAARHDARRHLSRIRVPALVLAGAHDVLIPPRRQRQLAQQLTRARFELIDCAGHDLTLEQPERTARSVEVFLSEVAPC